jgi:hypothetical protein
LRKVANKFLANGLKEEFYERSNMEPWLKKDDHMKKIDNL